MASPCISPVQGARTQAALQTRPRRPARHAGRRAPRQFCAASSTQRLPRRAHRPARRETQSRWLPRAPSALAVPAPLPPAPRQSTIFHILPYLTRLALSESNASLRLVASLACLMVAKAAGLYAPFFFKEAMDSLIATEAASAVAACATGLMLYGAMRLVSHVTKELQMPIFTPISQAVSRRVAHHTLSHVLDLDISFHLDRRTGTLSRVLERGTRATTMLFRAVAFTLMPTALELALVCATLGHLFHGAVVGVVVATFVAYIAWTMHFVGVYSIVRKHANKHDSAAAGQAVDALLNYETVALFNNETNEVLKYDRYLQRYQASMNRIERIGAWLNGGQHVMLNVGIVGTLLAATLCSPGRVTPGDLILIQGMLLQLWAPLQFLGWFFREVRQSLVDMEEFVRILHIQPVVKDGTDNLDVTADFRARSRAPHTAPGAQPAVGVSLDHNCAGCGLSVDFHSVNFSYTAERQILKNVSFRISPGQSVAIVGPSGSGKSSLLKLLSRLYEPDSGRVCVAGQDLADVRVASLREHLAVVPQETVLFNSSIMENIRYGRLSASDAEVRAAAELAQLDVAIRRMPEGYQTVVGERGLKLSGGEKQRVAIARAFLRDPRLLICDEATSALDTATERGIMDSLGVLARGRTSVFVAHRLSTVMHCDRIVVMVDGRVREEGTHEQLMARSGVYADMWRMQIGEEEEKKDELARVSLGSMDGLAAV